MESTFSTWGPVVATGKHKGSVVKGPLQTLDNRLIVYKGV